jgi:hypothetical protein
MPTAKVDFNAVRQIALQLPDVVESTTYGSPCFKARGELMTCIAIHSSAEPDSLAVRVDLEARAEMLADAPDVYYLTDHYVNYPFVLVRMNSLAHGALKDLLGMAWRLTTAKKAEKRAARKPGARGPRRRKAPRKT